MDYNITECGEADDDVDGPHSLRRAADTLECDVDGALDGD